MKLRMYILKITRLPGSPVAYLFIDALFRVLLFSIHRFYIILIGFILQCFIWMVLISSFRCSVLKYRNVFHLWAPVLPFQHFCNCWVGPGALNQLATWIIMLVVNNGMFSYVYVYISFIFCLIALAMTSRVMLSAIMKRHYCKECTKIQ